MKGLSNTEAEFKKSVAYKKKRVLWKHFGLFVSVKSMHVGLLRFLKHTFSLIRFARL